MERTALHVGDSPPVLIGADAIRQRVAELAEDLTRELAGTEPVVVGILTGAFMFVADLVREIGIPVEVDFIRAGSYGAARTSSGSVRLDPPGSLDWIGGRDIVFVEDILDTGRTLSAVVDHARELGARSVRSVVLLRKPLPPDCSETRIDAEHVGFDIGSRFVVGYGLDDGGKWRHLPYIGFVE